MELFSILFVDLCITFFLYCIFPIIYKCSHKNIEPKKAKKIALINSIVIFFIIAIYLAILGRTSNGTPAFLYYFINRAILNTNKNNKEETKNVIENEQKNAEQE